MLRPTALLTQGGESKKQGNEKHHLPCLKVMLPIECRRRKVVSEIKIIKNMKRRLGYRTESGKGSAWSESSAKNNGAPRSVRST